MEVEDRKFYSIAHELQIDERVACGLWSASLSRPSVTSGNLHEELSMSNAKTLEKFNIELALHHSGSMRWHVRRRIFNFANW